MRAASADMTCVLVSPASSQFFAGLGFSAAACSNLSVRPLDLLSWSSCSFLRLDIAVKGIYILVFSKNI